MPALFKLFAEQAGLDYQHGTGHGVGVYLGVHEGPHRISKAPILLPMRAEAAGDAEAAAALRRRVGIVEQGAARVK